MLPMHCPETPCLLFRVWCPRQRQTQPTSTRTYSSAWCTIPRTGPRWTGWPGLAESTHKLYATVVRRFTRVCTAAGLTVVPVSEGALCHFAATLAGEGLRHRTLSHIWQGFDICISLRDMGILSPMTSTGCTMSFVELGAFLRNWADLMGKVVARTLTCSITVTSA